MALRRAAHWRVSQIDDDETMFGVVMLALLYAVVAQAGSNPVPVMIRTVTSESRPDLQLEEALRRIEPEAFGGSGSYYYNRVDLNGDGVPEVLVLLDGDFCGSGGCLLLILQRQGEGRYIPINRVSLARPPIIVSEHHTGEWNDLILFVRGGGILPGYYAVLRFDGKRYPGNPKVAPARPLAAPTRGNGYLNDAHEVGAGIQFNRR